MNYQVTRFGGQYIIRREAKENPFVNWEIFSGYDFMGSVSWTEKITPDSMMDLDSAKATLEDLKAADM